VSTEEKRAQIIVKVALQGSGLPSPPRASEPPLVRPSILTVFHTIRKKHSRQPGDLWLRLTAGFRRFIRPESFRQSFRTVFF
jgi:hypothetical protein